MLDIRLDDEIDHGYQRKMDEKFASALYHENRGNTTLAAKELEMAIFYERLLLDHRRYILDKLIDDF